MYRLLVAAALIGLVGLASAGDRQGGETIATATGIWSLPFDSLGTTDGFMDDYDEECPYASTSPDVVYFWENFQQVEALTIDVCDADYDTKIYVYNDTYDMIACNDDFACPEGRSVQSRLENIPVVPGTVYYIVIDGSNGESGNYNISVYQTVGACCLSDGSCYVSLEAYCSGVWMGPDTDCDPNPCDPSAGESTTWGTIKQRFQEQ